MTDHAPRPPRAPLLRLLGSAVDSLQTAEDTAAASGMPTLARRIARVRAAAASIALAAVRRREEEDAA